MDNRQAPDAAAEPTSPSAWRRMNLKVKILALAGPVAAAAAFAHGMASDPPAAPQPEPFAAAVGQAVPAKPSAVLAAPALAFAGKGSAIRLDASAQAAPKATAPAPVADSLAKPEVAAAAVSSQAGSAAPHPKAAHLGSVAEPADPVLAALAGVEPNSRAMSQALVDLDLFASMVIAVENIEKRPYFDPGGVNVGMGYCITKRLQEYGKARVSADLLGAGFEPHDVDTLIKGRDRKAIAKIHVTPLMATRLVHATRDDYMGIARAAVGEGFDKMPEHRQVALGYIAYNTGDVGQFRKLLAALRSGDDAAAMRNMTVKWRDHDGQIHSNHRLRSYVQAMFLGKEHFKRAIANPMEFEGHMASPQAESALADIAGAAQKPGALGSKLLARRMQSNPWAFKALATEREKAAPAQPKL